MRSLTLGFMAISCVILFDSVPISNSYDDLQPEARELYNNRGCNLLYHAVLHVRLCKLLKPEQLGTYVRANSSHLWAVKMLVVVSYSDETRTMMEPMWLFVFYTYIVENNTRSFNRNQSNDVELQCIHNETFEVLRSRLQMDCPVLKTIDKPERVYDSYIGEIAEENDPAKLEENQSISRIFLEYSGIFNKETLWNRYMLSMNQLYLNNVIENVDVMDTLIARFGLIPNVDDLKTYFDSKYKTVLDPKTSLREHISALYDVQLHFVSMLKVMMLRLCVNYLTHVKQIKSVGPRSKYNQIFYAKFEEFAALLNLTGDDEVKMFSEHFKARINGDDNTLNAIQLYGMDVQNRISLVAKIACSDTDSVELPIGIFKSIAEINGLSTENQTSFMSFHEKSVKYVRVENSVLSANIFVEYLKQKFTDHDFFVISFFMNTYSL